MNCEDHLTTSQIGRIAESLVATTLILASGGRLSIFGAHVDDCGIDLIALDKKTSRSICVQVKSRSEREGKRARQFNIMRSSFRSDEQCYLLAFQFNPINPAIKRSWFIPMSMIPDVALIKRDRYTVSPSSHELSSDRYRRFRAETPSDLVAAILRALTLIAESGSPGRLNASSGIV
jgi:hypothetical protein